VSGFYTYYKHQYVQRIAQIIEGARLISIHLTAGRMVVLAGGVFSEKPNQDYEEGGTAEGYRFGHHHIHMFYLSVPFSFVYKTDCRDVATQQKATSPFYIFSKHGGAPLCEIRTYILLIKMEADMVQVERRSGKERRSGRDRRKRYTQGYGGSGRPDSRERRSGKDRRKSPPSKTQE
jgi:hypothetical protein